MVREDFRIRIRPDGQVYFYSQQLGDERLRQLREMLEDCLGPVVEMRSSGDEAPPGAVGLVDEEKRKELHQKS